jgi:hypothetical protein
MYVDIYTIGRIRVDIDSGVTWDLSKTCEAARGSTSWNPHDLESAS